MFPNVSIALVFYIALPMTIVYMLVILYMWPYKIETDPENPLNWYYPCTCKFWRRKRQPDSAHNPRIEAEIKNDRIQTEISLIESINDIDIERINIQKKEKELITRGILEVPARSLVQSNGKLVITELSKRYGDK